ncbi:DUF3040 domain-containing protein [Streptomyces sp. NPDC050418]|uniref:DUF3040 domain-containing protein n=1 Tax=Streptomyces sp. NPDC050418 TaxID=3365612 RepID=UPI0037BD5688
MSAFEDERLRALEAQLERDDPEFARALATGRPRGPCRPRERRRLRAWLMVGAAAGCLGTGIVIGHGLLIAAGLVIAGAATHLFDPPRHRGHGPHGTGTPP